MEVKIDNVSSKEQQEKPYKIKPYLNSNIAGAKPGSALAWLLLGLRGVGLGPFFVKISFSLVDISLDVQF